LISFKRNDTVDRIEESKKGAWIGIIGNSGLALMKVITGLMTGSMAILADGIDTSTDIFTSVVILISAHLSAKPPDRTHPYGHERAETLASKIISFVIFYAGLSLLEESITRLFKGTSELSLNLLAFLVVATSVAVKYYLYMYKYKLGKKLKNLAMISDAKNMRNDVLISSNVMLGLIIARFTGLWFLDSILAILISLFIIKTAFEIFMEASYELMDGLPKEKLGIYEDIFSAVSKVEGVYNPHRLRVRKVGPKLFVEMDVEVDGNMCVNKAHELTLKIKKALMEKRGDIADVTIHVEPLGNIEEEGFGISLKGEDTGEKFGESHSELYPKGQEKRYSKSLEKDGKAE